MAVDFDDINLLEIFQDMEKICELGGCCNHCKEGSCPLQYGIICVNRCANEGVTYVENGTANMPHTEISGCFDRDAAIKSIAHVLAQCKGCREDHYENCLLSILRNYLERMLIQETLPYEGSPLTYIVEFSKKNEVMACAILQEYKKKKEAM
jgi:hypothetical protein